MRKVVPVICFVLLVLFAAAAMGQTPEFRSMQIDSWHSGFESASATTSMVNYASSCNLNCVMPEVRLRSDAYYNSRFEPPGTGIAVSPAGFDSLADVITKAHAAGMQVHPWVVTFRIWTTATGPGQHYSPIDHVWWTHGPGRPGGADDWVMYSDTGAWDYGGVVNLDPGHPAVEDYLVSVFMDIVNNYAVDGLNLDYIRYPSTSWGYNPASVQRFNAEYGRSGQPSSSDSTWLNWRRDQVTNLVKRLYLEIKAVKPNVKLSADVWNSWSTGNSSYLQDWNAWLQNHWIDFVHPMMYTNNNTTYTGWLNDAINRQYGRYVFPLVDVSNDVNANILPQITDVRTHGFSGLGLYSYYSILNKTSLQSALVSGPFPTAVAPPAFPWLDTPTLGMLKGHVLNSGGYAIYPATVTIQTKSTKNTGTGFYGFTDLSTGTYTVTVSAPGYLDTSGSVTITAGQVATLDFTLGTDTTPPTISNVRTSNVQATNAQILWDTNENADSQVEYGLTTSYGSTTTLDPAQVTAHTVQITGLTRTTLYHYRVKSKDAAGNLTTSGDYTFTTAGSDTVADIIIDNPSATLVGAWTTGTSATDKYGTNYYYTSTAASETKSAKWTPSIITAGDYDVYVWYPQGANRSAMAPYTVYYNGGSVTTNVNQQTGGGQWVLIASAKSFAVGTAGYVKLGNGTGETSLNVMADAVKFSYVVTGDTQPPSVPTNLAATAVSETQVNLTWTASTDNVGVTGYKVFRNGTQIGTSTTTSYSDTTCSAGTTYSYTVSAYDAASNESAQSTAANVTTLDTHAPTVPTNLSATAVSGTQVDLSWTASTDNVGVTSYKVYRDGVQIGTSTTTSYSDTTCQPVHTYSYTVSACDAAANESAQSTAAVVTTPDSVPPTAPTNLAATVISQSQVDLTWTASTDNVGVTGYKVFRDGVQIGTSTTTSYSDTTCVGNTTYIYTVSAYDAAGNNSGLSNSASATTPLVTDIIMDNPSATYVGAWSTSATATDKYGADYSYTSTAATETKTATWTPNIGVAGYYTVYCWYPQGANRSAMAPYTVTWDGGSQTVNVNQQTGGGTWVTLVTSKKFAVGTGGSVKLGNGTGEASLNVMADAVRFLLVSDDVTPPSVPTNLAATTISSTRIDLAWTASTDNVGVTGYKIYRDGTQIGTSATTSYSDTTCQPGMTYTYKVSAYDAMGNESAQSAPATASTGDGQAPTVPTGLTATATSPSRISLSWTASTDNVGVTGYKVYRGGLYVTSVTTTSYIDTGRSPSTNYSYTVSAYDAASNESAQSTPASATTPALATIIMDNPAATYTGTWTTATSSTDKYGADYRWASTATSETATAKWTPTIQYPGNYNVYVWYPQGSNRATNAKYTTYWDGSNGTVSVNQTTSGGTWVLIQSIRHFLAGTAGYVKLSNNTGLTGKVVCADAVKFVQTSSD